MQKLELDDTGQSNQSKLIHRSRQAAKNFKIIENQFVTDLIYLFQETIEQKIDVAKRLTDQKYRLPPGQIGW